LPDIDVRPVRLAQVELPDFHPEAPGFDTIYGFVVREGANCLLVDTGVGTGNTLIERLYKPHRMEISVALAEAGVSPGQITAIVNSHLHFDHCGNNRLFPAVPIFVQKPELDAARRPHYTVAEWVEFPGANYVPVQGRHPISAHLELFPTPGHTPGHQSLLVRWGSHLEIIVAQAAYTAAEFESFRDLEPSDPTLQAYIQSNATWSSESYADSIAALWRLEPQRAFFSHDPVIWERAA
jgi:glyoxylase-like metal-dependent hydrolase (beta-lactamase superfamily II)